MVMAMAVRENGRTVMTWILGLTFSMAFVNPGATPIDLFPEWARPLIRMQPISPPIETMRSLAHGARLLGSRDDHHLGCRTAGRVRSSRGPRLPVGCRGQRIVQDQRGVTGYRP